MATYRVWAGSGVTQRANSTAYSLGARMQPAITDTSTNHAVAKRYVWECTTAGTSGASVPAWSASYTVDSSTITDGTVTWTCRAPGYSSGSTVDWTFAAIFLSYLQSLVAAGDFVLVQYTSQEASHSTAQTFSPTVDNVSVISVDKDAAEVYTPMATNGYIGNGSGAASFAISPAARQLALLGTTLRTAGTATGGHLIIGSADDGAIRMRDVRLEASANDVDPQIQLGVGGDSRASIDATNLTISRANASQIVRLSGRIRINGGATAGAASVATVFSTSATADSTGLTAEIQSFDMTTGVSSTATLVADGAIVPAQIDFNDCVLPSSYTVLSGASNVNDSGLIVRLKNCKAGSTTDIHGYYSALGSATANTTITYNGEALSWKIDASANATRTGPFVLPWMWGQISTGASVTPKIEILRDGSTTALTDAEVWCESEVGVTASSPLKTYASSEAAYTSSGTNIPTGAGLGSWAGESGTAWSGKLQTGAVTPTEDEAAMRICVATTTTIYAAMGWDT